MASAGLKRTKINFGPSFALDPTGGAYSAPPGPPLVGKGLAAPPQNTILDSTSGLWRFGASLLSPYVTLPKINPSYGLFSDQFSRTSCELK